MPATTTPDVRALASQEMAAPSSARYTDATRRTVCTRPWRRRAMESQVARPRRMYSGDVNLTLPPGRRVSRRSDWRSSPNRHRPRTETRQRTVRGAIPPETSTVCSVVAECEVRVTGGNSTTPSPASLGFATSGPSDGTCFHHETDFRVDLIWSLFINTLSCRTGHGYNRYALDIARNTGAVLAPVGYASLKELGTPINTVNKQGVGPS